MTNQITENIKEMQKVVNCLALELPEVIHDDVKMKWNKLKDSLSALKTCSDVNCQNRKEN